MSKGKKARKKGWKRLQVAIPDVPPSPAFPGARWAFGLTDDGRIWLDFEPLRETFAEELKAGAPEMITENPLRPELKGVTLVPLNWVRSLARPAFQPTLDAIEAWARHTFATRGGASS